jgi:hypothetical protein
MDKFVSSFKNVDWKEYGADFAVFGQRFASSDFAKISPKPGEEPAVAGHFPRMAALIVWRRALLAMAFVLGVILFIKSCFDPHTYHAAREKNIFELSIKANPTANADQTKQLREQAKAEADGEVKMIGESNVEVIDGLMGGLWLCLPVSLVFQVLAARAWREWRKSRKMALIGVGVLLIPQLLAMIIPWAAMMDFKHLAAQGANTLQISGVKQGVQLAVMLAVLFTALPFFYGFVNGVLRASLSTKTLIPASIVCGWGSMLLAATIAVPWYIVLSIVSQIEAEGLIILGVICLLAAPLSIVFKARRLGVPLTPEEATPLVKRTKMWLTGLNALGVAMIIAYFMDRDKVTAMDVVTMIIHYFANLMLVQVVAVDMLVLLLDRAHRKLLADTTPDESLRQLGEVLSVK